MLHRLKTTANTQGATLVAKYTHMINEFAEVYQAANLCHQIMQYDFAADRSLCSPSAKRGLAN